MPSKTRLFLLIASLVFFCGCVPLQPSVKQVSGKWRLARRCGTEHLELKADGSYVQEIEYANGARATQAGSWSIEPRHSKLEGAHIILHNAIIYCSLGDDRLLNPEVADISLETDWEWGRIVLNYNPDLQGYTRE